MEAAAVASGEEAEAAGSDEVEEAQAGTDSSAAPLATAIGHDELEGPAAEAALGSEAAHVGVDSAVFRWAVAVAVAAYDHVGHKGS